MKKKTSQKHDAIAYKLEEFRFLAYILIHNPHIIKDCVDQVLNSMPTNKNYSEIVEMSCLTSPLSSTFFMRLREFGNIVNLEEIMSEEFAEL